MEEAREIENLIKREVSRRDERNFIEKMKTNATEKEQREIDFIYRDIFAPTPFRYSAKSTFG